VVYRNHQITRSFAFSLILACGLAVTGCGGAVAAPVQGGGASDAVVNASALGLEQHAVASSEGADPYASARDIGTGELIRDIGTGEAYFTAAAAPLGPGQHMVVSTDGRDPYVSARDFGTGEFITDIATGESLR